jgi:hypothetical protein
MAPSMAVAVTTASTFIFAMVAAMAPFFLELPLDKEPPATVTFIYENKKLVIKRQGRTNDRQGVRGVVICFKVSIAWRSVQASVDRSNIQRRLARKSIRKDIASGDFNAL